MTEQTIFTAALEQEPARRGAFLDEACAGNSELRQRVEVLLKAHEQHHELLDGTGALTTLGQPPTERPGTQIGPYKLLQQIGEGGMGVVYMAEQTQPVQRRVALKVIKAGMDSRQVIARFEAERQALAVMDHVNIARVLDAGATEQGRPYFVMELVNGVPITKYCDDNRLTPRQRLELFVPVCQAIQHAHQKGIIHRDIKPSNVLVTLYDGQPVPKVIDFGVAKAIEQKLTERTLFTQHGSMVGTLEYVSPEQAEMSALGVDTRSDIFSLGVLLYELLTGGTPLGDKRIKEAAYAEILRMIKEEEPPKPSTRLSDSGEGLASISANRHMEPAKLTKLVRGELDWIVMKALEKDRSRRYETASGFAADVLHYLADEPVLACPPSSFYRFRKFVRRNQSRLLTGGSLALAALITAGVVAASLGWTARDRQMRHTRLNHEAELALKEASQARERALTLTDNPYQWEAALAAAGSAVKSAMGIAAQDDAALTPDLQRQLRSLQAALDADLRDRQFAARFDAIRLEQSELNLTWISFKLDDAYPAIRQALDDFYRLRIGTTPIDQAKRAVLELPLPVQQYLLAALEVALMYAPPGDAAAQAWLKGVLAAVDTAPWRQRARQAVEAEDWPALERLVGELATTRQPAADLLRIADRAPVESTSKLAMLRRIRQTYASDFWANHQLATALHRRQDPQLDEAIRYYAAANALRPNNAVAVCNLADALRERGSYEEALAAYQDALRLAANNASAYVGIGITHMVQNRQDEAIAAMREVIRLRPAQAVGYSQVGDILMKQKRFAEAEPLLREAARLESQIGWYHILIGNCLLLQDRPAEAEVEHREGIRLGPSSAYFHESLGRALLAQEKFDDAEQAYLDATRRHPGRLESHTFLAELRQKRGTAKAASETLRASLEQSAGNYDAHLQRGLLLKLQGDFAAAETALHEAVRLRPDMPSGHLELGRVLLSLKQPAQAELAFREAVRLRPDMPNGYLELGRVLESLKQPAQAEMAYREAIRLQPSSSGAHSVLAWLLFVERNFLGAETEFREVIRLSPDAAGAHFGLGRALRGQQRFEDAVASYRESIRVCPNDLHVGDGAHLDLAGLYLEQKHWLEAEAEFREAIRIKPDRAASFQGLRRTLAEQGKLAEAEEAEREAIRLMPDYPAAYDALGWARISQQQYAEAEAEFRNAIRIVPERAESFHGLGKALVEQKRLAEAEKAEREAIRLMPDYTAAHGALGWVLIRQQRYAEAEAEFRKVIRLDPNRAAAHFGLGKALFEQGRFADAEAALREEIRVHPEYRHGASELLARALAAQGKPNETAPAPCAKSTEEVSPKP